MAMNREQKRMMQRQGQVDADGAPAPQKRQPQRTSRPLKEERAGPIQFLREVRGELRKVAWPTRSEVVHYTIIVLITIAVMTAFIGVIDYAFGEGVFGHTDR
jgi:preprotein translocase subunit SecE